MFREIGSEFWNDGPQKRDQVFLLSGRTALEFVIRDMKKRLDVKSALLPSYCCHTMIEPFYRHGVSVRFYDVYFNKEHGLSAEIPPAHENEVFYDMTYFGFRHLAKSSQPSQNDFVAFIEDKTHSWLSDNKESTADYSYASYRKWTGFDALALATKREGEFSNFPTLFNSQYSDLRKRAASMKRSFMESGTGDKQDFLDLFAKAEEALEKDYVGYKPTSETIAAFAQLDVSTIAETRRRNARILIEGLKDVSEITLIFPSVKDDEVPLFVPILLRENRNELRKMLIKNAIYCPIHWPKSYYHQSISQRANELYIQEMSLVCDQRYRTDDMNRVVECIRKYYKR